MRMNDDEIRHEEEVGDLWVELYGRKRVRTRKARAWIVIVGSVLVSFGIAVVLATFYEPSLRNMALFWTGTGAGLGSTLAAMWMADGE